MVALVFVAVYFYFCGGAAESALSSLEEEDLNRSPEKILH